MMNSIFLTSWHKYVPSLRLFLFTCDFIPRIVPKGSLREIRGYKIVRAYGSGLLFPFSKGIPQKVLDKIFQTFHAPLAGFFTYGEFGRTTNGSNEFHANTCCWVALKEK